MPRPARTTVWHAGDRCRRRPVHVAPGTPRHRHSPEAASTRRQAWSASSRRPARTTCTVSGAPTRQWIRPHSHASCAVRSRPPADVLFVSGYSLLNEGCRLALEAVLTSPDPARPLIAMDPASIDAMNSMGRDAVLAVARLCDYFLPNEEEACWLAQVPDATKAAGILHRSTGTTIVVKLGSGGALLYGDEGIITTPGVALEPVDVTGAGDSFAAAFLSARVSNSDLPAALDGRRALQRSQGPAGRHTASGAPELQGLTSAPADPSPCRAAARNDPQLPARPG